LTVFRNRWGIGAVVLYGLILCATAAPGTPGQPVPPAPTANLLDKPLGEDGFYMLSVARSLAEGDGFSYGTVPTTGVQPLATVLYAGVYWLANLFSWGDDGALRGVIFLNVLLLAAVGVASGWLVRGHLDNAGVDGSQADWMVASLVVINAAAFRLFTYGLETGLYLFCIVLVQLSVLHRRHAIVVGTLSGLCFLARLDFAILMMVVVAIEIWRRRFTMREVSIMTLAAGVVAAPWLLYVYRVTGGLMPSSGGSQAALIGSIGDLVHRGWSWLSSAVLAGTGVLYLPLLDSPLQRVVVTLLAIGVALGIWTLRKELRAAWAAQWPWFAGAGVVAAYYLAASYAVHFYPRYMAPVWLVWLQVFGGAAAVFAARLRLSSRAVAGFSTLLVALFAVQVGYTLHRGAAGNTHLFTGFYIERHQPQLGMVGAFQSGVVGYMTREHTVNLDGKLDGRALAWRDAGRLECYLAERRVTTLIDWQSNIDNGWIDRGFVENRMREVDRIEGGASIVMRVDATGLDCPAQP
jgi:hypothetical protein